ncbi:ankyrin repeat-containing domain protein [Neocallimastix lanati (nom. inval.)]|nr:ankyrin repeat-containing domain protein [Neocallimastix sp. JGI-2020a]
MDFKEENKNNIIEIIKNNNINELKKYINENDISLNELSKVDFDILIYSIENNISIDIIKYIIGQSRYKTLNFHIIDNDVFKTPLFSAIGYNNFKIADILLKNKADINYNNYDIINNLNKHNLLNSKNLKYILNRGFSIAGITNHLIYTFIDNFQNGFLEIIFKHFKFNPSFILNFLNLYKRGESLLNEDSSLFKEDLEEIIMNEKDKLYINDTMYDKALEKGNNEALKILFENENSEENEILNRIFKYDLLEVSVKMNNYNFVKSVLYYQTFNFKYIQYEKILSEAIENDIDIKIKKLLIKTLVQSTPINGLNRKNKNFCQQKINLILNMAIKLNHFSIVQYMMENMEFQSKMDINIKDSKGEYPLLKAFNSQNMEIFKYLLEHGANSNIKNKNGVSLLMLAIHKNNVEVIKLLLKYNVNIIEKDSNGLSPLEKAVNQNNTDIVRLFIKYCNINKIIMNANAKDASGNTLLMKAVNQNNGDIVKLLINYCFKNKIKININEKDASGHYPLMKGINQNNFDIVFSLVNYGIKNNIKMSITDIEGNTPMTLAYKKGNIKIFRYLVSYLDINQKDGQHNSILYYAIEKEDIETVKDLISIGIDINLKNSFEDAAVDCAIFKGNLEIMDILLENDNVLLNKRNYLGKTPLISMIKADNYTPDQKERIIDRFIEKGTDVNLTDKDGNSPLACAIKENYLSIVKLLIKNGANVNTKNKDGNSPLVDAIQANNLTVVKLLTENGADVHIKNNEGNSSLEYAVHAENYEIANYLYNYMDMMLKTIVCKNSVMTNCTQKLINYINTMNSHESSFNTFSKFNLQSIQNYHYYDNDNRVI